MTVRKPAPAFTRHFSEFFDQIYRVRAVDASIPVHERFVGANVRVPGGVRTILDVGCGDGQFLQWLPDLYWKVGLDMSAPALRRAGGLVVQGSVEALPFADASFDLVTCFEVLEHLPYGTYRQAVRELGRVSQRYMVIGVPNREVLAQSLVWCPRCYCAFNASWHVRAFDEAVLASLFAQFSMVECRACGPEARYGAWRLADWLVLLARRPPPPLALCPQCGYSEAAGIDSADRGSPGDSPRFLRSFGRRLLLRDRRPYWLVAVYVRNR